MKNFKTSTMKKLTTLLLAVAILMSSCTTHEDRINRFNNVAQYTKSVQGTTYLITRVTFRGMGYSLEADEISSLSTDSIFAITESRSKDANELLLKLKALNE